MAAELVGVTTANASGSLTSLGTSLVKLGGTTKAFLATHPTVAGFAMGVTSVYMLNRLLGRRRKKKAIAALQTA